MASQREVKNRIASFKNIQKITRAMEAVSAARLRRAEQRIAPLRPSRDPLRLRIGSELEAEQRTPVWFASGRRGVSSLSFRGKTLDGSYTGFTDRPSYAD